MTIERILEPEVMHGLDEAISYDEMDHRQVNAQFVEDLLAHLPRFDPKEVPEILDLGTGTGLIAIELCRRHATCRVLGIDLATSMLELAQCKVEVAGLRDRIRFERVDAKGMTYETGRFAVVMSNSILHHIPQPVTVVEQAARVVRAGGVLFFRDLLRPATVADMERLVESYAGRESVRAQQLFRDSLHAALSIQEVRDLVTNYGFPAESVQITSDRHWTWIGTSPQRTA